MYPGETTLKEHPFDLRGMKAKDWFMGCKSCGFQLEPKVAAGAYPCNCGGRLNIFYITPEDAVLV